MYEKASLIMFIRNIKKDLILDRDVFGSVAHVCQLDQGSEYESTMQIHTVKSPLPTYHIFHFLGK